MKQIKVTSKKLETIISSYEELYELMKSKGIPYAYCVVGEYDHMFHAFFANCEMRVCKFVMVDPDGNVQPTQGFLMDYTYTTTAIKTKQDSEY